MAGQKLQNKLVKLEEQIKEEKMTRQKLQTKLIKLEEQKEGRDMDSIIFKIENGAENVITMLNYKVQEETER